MADQKAKEAEAAEETARNEPMKNKRSCEGSNPENIAKAEEAIKTKEAGVKSAEESVKTAEEGVKSAETAGS
ncbi:MAG: hypothetical protein ACLRZG_01680 [Streptococcus sp.]